jgi:nucleoside-diphosphate-sugar epimerase
MRMLAGTGALSIDRARRLLDWEPQVDLEEGMRRTEAWLQDQGELD